MSVANVLQVFDYPLNCAREWNEDRQGIYNDCFALWRVFDNGERTALESPEAEKFLDTQQFSRLIHVEYQDNSRDSDWCLVGRHACGSYVAMSGGCTYTGFGWGLGKMEINVSDNLTTLARKALTNAERCDLAEALQRKNVLDECLGFYLAEAIQLHLYELLVFANGYSWSPC